MKVLLALLLLLIPGVALAQRGGSSNDPFVFGENLRQDQFYSNAGFNNLIGRTCLTDAGGRPCVPTINPAVKTLILIAFGDSIGASAVPSAFVPTNLASINNFNVYDGAIYPDLDPLLGQSYATLGPGSMNPRLADLLITNGSFSRVIMVPTNIGGSQSNQWGVGGPLYNKVCAGIRRLAQRGITPATTGVTFGAILRLGPNDAAAGTTSAAYQLAVNQQVAYMQSCGFSGRVFVDISTMLSNVVNATIQGAQAALVSSGAPYFAGGNLDSLTGANKQPDGTHPSDLGSANGAALEYTAMHASGAPY